MVYGPNGAPLVEPLKPNDEGLLVVDVYLRDIVDAKQMINVVGHYSRPDLLSLQITIEAASMPLLKAREAVN